MTSSPDPGLGTLNRRLSAADNGLWDVVIVGAGPAGATAANYLASAGRRVLLLDKSRFPREKICGDGLIPDALNGLRALGLYEEVCDAGFRVNRLVIMSPSGIRVEVPAECVTLKRAVLDKLIVERAIATGTVFRVGTVTAVDGDEPDGVRVHSTDAAVALRGRVVLIATGADIALLDRLGVVTHRKHSAVALRCYVKAAADLDELVVSFDRAVAPGYAWIFPLGHREYNVGCGVFSGGKSLTGVNLREAFSRFITKTSVARRLMSNGRIISPLKGARLRSDLGGAVSGAGGRILPIGEALGSTYPFTGEGIGKAIETGAVAAERIEDALASEDFGQLADLPNDIARALSPRFRGYQVAQRWLSRPWLSDLVAARVRASVRLQEAVAGVINETVDPRTIFSWRTVVAALGTSVLHRTRGNGSG